MPYLRSQSPVPGVRSHMFPSFSYRVIWLASIWNLQWIDINLLVVPELSWFTSLLLNNSFALWSSSYKPSTKCQFALFSVQPQRKQTYELPLLLHLWVTGQIQAQYKIISWLFSPGNRMSNPRLLQEMWLFLVLLIRSLQDTEYSY